MYITQNNLDQYLNDMDYDLSGIECISKENINLELPENIIEI